jgi:DNA-binding MarR family transcriptional regulator
MAEHNFHDTTGYLLSQVCKLYRARANERLEAIGLHQGQDLILCELSLCDGQTQSELVERLCVQPSTLTNSLHSMERAGLVQRRADDEDQRVSRVYLTDQIRSTWPQIRQAQETTEAQAFARLSVEERMLLRRLLMQVAENLAGLD